MYFEHILSNYSHGQQWVKSCADFGHRVSVVWAREAHRSDYHWRRGVDQYWFSWNICFGVVRVLEANIQRCGDMISWRSRMRFVLHSAKPAWFTAVICAKFHVLCNIWSVLNFKVLNIIRISYTWHFHWLLIDIPFIFIHVCWWILFDLSKTLYCVFWDLFWTDILQIVTILQLIFRLMWYSSNKI